MNINETLNLTAELQRCWMEEQEWYKSSDFTYDLETAYPFLNIFDSIPNIWSESFIYDLLHDSTWVSDERLLEVQSGLSLTDKEIDEIREELADYELETFSALEARKIEFEFFDEILIAVFVGGSERRCEWDPEFIGLYRTITEAKKAIYSLYKEYYITDKFALML